MTRSKRCFLSFLSHTGCTGNRKPRVHTADVATSKPRPVGFFEVSGSPLYCLRLTKKLTWRPSEKPAILPGNSRVCFRVAGNKTIKGTFVDAFAGCGGLSLGLLQAGMHGLLAIERDKFAFKTLFNNLLAPGSRHTLGWPNWLPQKPISIGRLLSKHRQSLKLLRGSVDVLVGGPPCQGFSSAGRRKHDDPRNKLFKSYLELVDILQPKIVLMENVRGFTANFDTGTRSLNYAKKLRATLSAQYNVYEDLVNLTQFGLPQNRTRYLLIALKSGTYDGDPFELLRRSLPNYLKSLGLRIPVSSRSAISDLEALKNGRVPSTENKRYFQIEYKRPRTRYQKIMNGGVQPSDLRLALHSTHIAKRFVKIIESCQAEERLNTAISKKLKARFRLKKAALRVLDPSRPSPTITSMPDDLLHYKEPRTLTVRENARLQGFPDWFQFHGKYTTGGHLRRREVPRFTQVANAVPPLVARALGKVLGDILSKPAVNTSSRRAQSRK